MPSVNMVILAGHLTRDVELKYTPSGTAVGSLGLAMNRKWKDSKSNEWREEVTFVDIEIWGKQAETANQYLHKGDAALFEGRLKLDQWDDKTSGQKRSKLKVVAERMQFLGAKKGEGKSAPKTSAGASVSADTSADAGEDLEIQEDSIPF